MLKCYRVPGHVDALDWPERCECLSNGILSQLIVDRAHVNTAHYGKRPLPLSCNLKQNQTKNKIIKKLTSRDSQKTALKIVSVIEDRTSILQTYWHRRHSTDSALPPNITRMSTEQPHACQEMEGNRVPVLYVAHVCVKMFLYLLLHTDCKGESGSPKPAMVSEAICKELGIWLEKRTTRKNCNE